VVRGGVRRLTNGLRLPQELAASVVGVGKSLLVEKRPSAFADASWTGNMTNRLLLVPGVGADWRLFDEQRSCVADLHVIEWVPPVAADEPLTDYAKRLAATIDTSSPFIIGGASFGGMIALEAARHIQPDAVILIGSCRSPSSLPSSYRFLRACSDLVPDALFGWSFTAAPLIASRFGVRSPEHRQLFTNMLRHTPPSFVRWAARAIFSWSGIDELPVPIHHIHGEEDRIIPLRCVRPDVVVKRAGHMLNVTHPAEVNAFIETAMSSNTPLPVEYS
jgi:pimeloyl-ACP methyl ester carboxylesterase